jgi:hypothetical protein
MSLLSSACADVAVCLTANPKHTAGELRVIVGWFREARDQTSRHRGEADTYAIDLACYLAAVEGNPDPLRKIAGAYLALDVCPFEAPAYEYLERCYFAEIAALLRRPSGELLEPTKRHAPGWWRRYSAEADRHRKARHEHLNKAASGFVNAIPDVTAVIDAILTVWAEERENPIDAVLKQMRESDGIIAPTLTEEDEKLLGEITERYRNLLLACRALETDDHEYMDSIGGSGGVIDQILLNPSRAALWRAQSWIHWLDGDHAKDGESWCAGQARLLRDTLRQELVIAEEWRVPLPD